MEAIVRYKVALRFKATARSATYAYIYVGQAFRKGA